MSPLSQGRGLKPDDLLTELDAWRSPLSQGRGLKQFDQDGAGRGVIVAPLAGAWIETGKALCLFSPVMRRPSRRGVD